jgi:hypothetical protein
MSKSNGTYATEGQAKRAARRELPHGRRFRLVELLTGWAWAAEGSDHEKDAWERGLWDVVNGDGMLVMQCTGLMS